MYYWASNGLTLVLLILSLFGYQECTFWANWLICVRNIMRLFDFEKTKPVMGESFHFNQVFQTVGVLITVVV